LIERAVIIGRRLYSKIHSEDLTPDPHGKDFVGRKKGWFTLGDREDKPLIPKKTQTCYKKLSGEKS
jgi:hypothetical protein